MSKPQLKSDRSFGERKGSKGMASSPDKDSKSDLRKSGTIHKTPSQQKISQNALFSKSK